MTEIVIEVPGPETTGYLRRLIAVNRYRELHNAGKRSAEYYEEMAEYLLGFVSKPEDRTEAMNLLLDLSGEQFNDILKQVNDKLTDNTNPTQPSRNETS